jgi:hypothetical protein
MSKKKILWSSTALSIPLEDGWSLDLRIWEEEHTEYEDKKNERRWTKDQTHWNFRRFNSEGDCISMFCSEAKADAIIKHLARQEKPIAKAPAGSHESGGKSVVKKCVFGHPLPALQTCAACGFQGDIDLNSTCPECNADPPACPTCYS